MEARKCQKMHVTWNVVSLARLVFLNVSHYTANRRSNANPESY